MQDALPLKLIFFTYLNLGDSSFDVYSKALTPLLTCDRQVSRQPRAVKAESESTHLPRNDFRLKKMGHEKHDQ